MENLPNKSGIYLIKSTVNGKEYVGSAVNLKQRKTQHFSGLRLGKHKNGHLQNHYNKHGGVFEFSILEYCEKEKLIEREQFYMDARKPQFNICKIAGSCLGVKHSSSEYRKNWYAGQKRRWETPLSEETIKRKRAAMKKEWAKRKKNGFEVSEEARRNMSKSQKKKWQSKEFRDKFSIAKKGYKHSEEAKKNMKAAQRKRRKENPVSEGFKNKMSELKMGHSVSEGTREKLRKAQTGKKASEATRKKLSEAAAGRTHTEQSKKKMSENQRGKGKLTERQVIEIKRQLNIGITCIEIAKKYNVSNWAIHNIKQGKTWKHINAELYS